MLIALKYKIIFQTDFAQSPSVYPFAINIHETEWPAFHILEL